MEDVLIKMIVHIVRGYKLVRWTLSGDGLGEKTKGQKNGVTIIMVKVYS